MSLKLKHQTMDFSLVNFDQETATYLEDSTTVPRNLRHVLTIKVKQTSPVMTRVTIGAKYFMRNSARITPDPLYGADVRLGENIIEEYTRQVPTSLLPTSVSNWGDFFTADLHGAAVAGFQVLSSLKTANVSIPAFIG